MRGASGLVRYEPLRVNRKETRVALVIRRGVCGLAGQPSWHTRALSGSPPPPLTCMTLATWESGYPAACKAVYTGSNPVVASNTA